ncbi:MAG: hypothetical protein HY520_03040, partial [Candidatus Aenigmarchaeota archaeon]|nr:hypothetical protein [Candidatus Aenigmarchaeota archaeon]
VPFSAVISNAPASLALLPPACQAACSSATVNCTAPCSVSCSPPAGASNACTLEFSIPGYSAANSYTVEHNLTFPISYQDGPAQRSATLEGSFPTIRFGPQFCGNGVCDPGEDFLNCCYDCACPSGYCNTAAPPGPSSGDVCAPDGMQLVVEGTSSRVFVDQNKVHTINVSARLLNAPPNPPPYGLLNRVDSCSLWGGAIAGCVASCVPGSQQGADLPLDCVVTLPAGITNPSTTFTMTGNLLTLAFQYNNGSQRFSTRLDAQLGDITLTQVSTCGNGACESALGEDSQNCCIDCPCSAGNLCVPGGVNPQSSCILNTSLNLSSTFVSPSPLTCMILPPHARGGCRFTDTLLARLEVTNAPSTLDFVSATYQFPGEKPEQGSCTPFFGDNDSVMDCRVAVDNLDDPGSCGNRFSCIPPGEEQRNATFFLTFSYDDAGHRVIRQFSTLVPFTIEKDDKRIASCQERRDRLESKLDTYERNKGIIQTILALLFVFIGIDAARCVLCNTGIFSAIGCEPPLITGALLGKTSCTEVAGLSQIAACFAGPLLFAYGNYEDAIPRVRDQQQAICMAPDTRSIAEEEGGFSIPLYDVLGGAAIGFCLLGNYLGDGEEGATAGVSESGGTGATGSASGSAGVGAGGGASGGASGGAGGASGSAGGSAG